MTIRVKWSAARLAYTVEQRRSIMACIQRLNARQGRAVPHLSYGTSSERIYDPKVRDQIRAWYYERWLYLIREYEKVLPHVDELPE